MIPFLFKFKIYLFGGQGTHGMVSMWMSEDNLGELSFSTMWFLGIKLGLSGLVANEPYHQPMSHFSYVSHITH